MKRVFFLAALAVVILRYDFPPLVEYQIQDCHRSLFAGWLDAAHVDPDDVDEDFLVNKLKSQRAFCQVKILRDI